MLRDYRVECILSEAYMDLASGQAMWALIDTASRRTASMPAALAATFQRERIRSQSRIECVQRLAAASDLRLYTDHRVGFHDCDFNGHLNNVVAAGWLLDSLYDGSLLEDRGKPTRYRLTYLREALQGEVISVWKQDLSGMHHSAELRNVAQQPIARLRVDATSSSA